eukprot:GHVU01065361.1.p1 GENE.GHVU01065361.1~~GHVU01065361.1.p1  ORF type:complete len:437 (+),score=85.02 GHVU01065361.1:275-1585(+)
MMEPPTNAGNDVNTNENGEECSENNGGQAALFALEGSDKVKVDWDKKFKNIAKESVVVHLTGGKTKDGEDEFIIMCDGESLEKAHAKGIRNVASALGVGALRGMRKDQMLLAIKNAKETHQTYDYDKCAEGSRKGIQCTFRLLNVLFSDRFAYQLGTLGDTASRQELDGGQAANDELFWRDVRSSFVSEDSEFGTLQFSDNIFTARGMDLNVIIPHEWAKLRGMWKQLNADYKTALRKFTQSGTHTSDFYAYCSGKLDIFYLRKLLNLKPQLNATVEAALPEGAFVDSSNASALVHPRSVQAAGSNKRKHPDAAAALESVLRSHAEAKERSDAQTLREVEKMDARHAATMKLLHERNDIERKKLAMNDGALAKWEEARTVIGRLRGEIQLEQDTATKADLQKDLQVMLDLKLNLTKRIQEDSGVPADNSAAHSLSK